MKRFLFLEEWKRIFKSPRDIIQISAILLIPILYAGMFIWAFWDPYGQIKHLPVAVVNTDRGAELQGEKLALGSKLVDNLKEKKSFDFHFVDEKQAYKGLKARKYYMIIEVPEKFSSNAATLLDKHPKKLELKYIQNPSMNYTSSKIEDSAIKEIKAGIAKEVTAAYAEEMFKNMKQMANGYKQASNGAEKLNSGAVNLKEGSAQLKDSLKTLAVKSIDFNEGIGVAKSGASDLAKGSHDLAMGMNQLSAGSNKLLDASKSLESGANKAADGSSKLNAGLGQIDTKLPALISGTEQAKKGAESIQNQLPEGIASGIQKQMENSSKQLDSGLTQLQTQLGSKLSAGIADQIYQQETAQMQQIFTALQGKLPDNVLQELEKQVKQTAPSKEAMQEELSKGINQGLDQGFTQFKTQVNNQTADSAGNIQSQIEQQIAPSFQQLINGLDTINQNQKELKYGVHQLYTGSQDLKQGTEQLKEGQKQYTGSMSTFNQKLQSADAGSKNVAAGANQLASGLGQLQDGSSKLQSGTQKIADGSNTLVNGTSKLSNGTDELKNKLQDASQKAGNIHADDNTYDMMGAPVDLAGSKLNNVPNYGTGLTPYFLSLGLFVGALLLTIVYPIKDPAVMPNNGITWYLSKFGVMVCVGILQSLIADAIILFGLGVDVQSVPLFIISTVVTSLTYMAIIQFFVGLFGNPGRYLAIIILILQLTTSAGTFPLELLPQGLQHIHYALPMAYSLQAFKAVISSGDFSFMWFNVNVLLIYLISFMILTLVYFVIKFKRSRESIVLIDGEKTAHS